MTVMSNSPKTFTAGEALGVFLRVKIAGATRAAWLADAADYGVGTVLEGVAISKDVTVRLWNHGGSHKCVSSCAISAGKKVMLEKDVFPKLAEQGRLRGFPFAGQWFDTGNMQRYTTAKKKWKDIDPYEDFEEED